MVSKPAWLGLASTQGRGEERNVPPKHQGDVVLDFCRLLPYLFSKYRDSIVVVESPLVVFFLFSSWCCHMHPVESSLTGIAGQGRALPRR